jgi:hypothetical protein
VKVWLDDEREAPEGWVHVRTPEEAIELLRAGEVEELSLDHDLGLDVGRDERTAMTCSSGSRPSSRVRRALTSGRHQASWMARSRVWREHMA